MMISPTYLHKKTCGFLFELLNFHWYYRWFELYRQPRWNIRYLDSFKSQIERAQLNTVWQKSTIKKSPLDFFAWFGKLWLQFMYRDRKNYWYWPNPSGVDSFSHRNSRYLFSRRRLFILTFWYFNNHKSALHSIPIYYSKT